MPANRWFLKKSASLERQCSFAVDAARAPSTVVSHDDAARSTTPAHPATKAERMSPVPVAAMPMVSPIDEAMTTRDTAFAPASTTSSARLSQPAPPEFRGALGQPPHERTAASTSCCSGTWCGAMRRRKTQ